MDPKETTLFALLGWQAFQMPGSGLPLIDMWVKNRGRHSLCTLAHLHRQPWQAAPQLQALCPGR